MTYLFQRACHRHHLPFHMHLVSGGGALGVGVATGPEGHNENTSWCPFSAMAMPDVIPRRRNEEMLHVRLVRSLIV